MKIRPAAFAKNHPILSLFIGLQIALLVVLAQALDGLRSSIDKSYEREDDALKMVLASYTLRQSSDYLTRFARHYAVTSEPSYRKMYQQVLNIRRGEALRPKNYEAIYWDLTEPYRSNAHPLLHPQSLENILTRLPLTKEELDLLLLAEKQSEKLAEVEMHAFEAVESGQADTAINALFSVDYIRAKHEVMKPIDEFMTRIRERIKRERATARDQINAEMQRVLWTTFFILAVNITLYLRWPRRSHAESKPLSNVSSVDGQG